MELGALYRQLEVSALCFRAGAAYGKSRLEISEIVRYNLRGQCLQGYRERECEVIER